MFSRIPDANFCPKAGGLLPGLDFHLTIPSPETTHDGGGVEAPSIRVKNYMLTDFPPRNGVCCFRTHIHAARGNVGHNWYYQPIVP